MNAPDVLAHRDWITALVELPTKGLVVDLGCGRGEDLLAFAARSRSRHVRFQGIDRSEKAIAVARKAVAGSPNVEFRVEESGDVLPWPDASVDVVYSQNLLECIVDKPGWLQEVRRILRPGGQVVCGHWDWDSQLYEADDKDVVRRLVHAFADWQQGWMDTSDGWMGRRLWGVFEGSGLFTGRIEQRVMTNTIYAEPWFGHARAQDFASLVRRELVSRADYDVFLADMVNMARRRRYFYAITSFVYIGQRAA